MIQLLLAHEHRLLRELLLYRLGADPEFAVVGEAVSTFEAYRLADAAPGLDVVLVDAELPGGGGAAATRELLRRDPLRRVLVLSRHADARLVQPVIWQALAAGALGFALRDQPFDELRAALLAVGRGEQVLPAGASQAYLQHMQEHHLKERLAQRVAAAGGLDDDFSDGSPLGALTSREKEVFDLLAHGVPNGGIADRLGISINTVETHRARILKKLGAHSLSDIVRVAARHGLLSHA